MGAPALHGHSLLGKLQCVDAVSAIGGRFRMESPSTAAISRIGKADVRASERGQAVADSGGQWLRASDRPLLVWALSFGFWSFVTVVLGVTTFLFKLAAGMPARFVVELAVQTSQMFAFALFTPLVLLLATRFPFQSTNWGRPLLVHTAGAVAFVLGHVMLRGVTPYASWDFQARGWVSALDGSLAQGFHPNWRAFESLLISSAAEDILFVYAPIVLIAHAVSYHRRFRQGEHRKAQLESQLATARLEALKSQLQPHFLFNTLHSISSLMLTDVAAADQMMSLLSDLLRMSLAGSSQITTLGDELQFVNTYLQIERIRFEERLKVVLDIEPDTLDALVPRLLLQPLVENAVRHGVSRLPSGGQIRIASHRDGRHLVVRVIDNGPGLDDSECLPQTSGLGLQATQERLRTLYAGEQQMDIRDAGEGGVEVFLRIPFEVRDLRHPESAPNLLPHESGQGSRT
jgi:two-component system LytT family sensor kinase